MILNEYSKTAWIDGASPSMNKVTLDNLEQGVYDVTAKAMELAAYETNAAASATSAAASAAVYTDLAQDVTDLTTDLSTLDTDVTNLKAVVASHAKYSTTEEVVIGTYNGKPLYRKALLISSLPNNAQVSYPHGIINTEKIIIGSDSHYTDGINFLPSSFSSNVSTANIGIYVNATNVIITASMNRSSLSAIIFLEYTKTTDTVETNPEIPTYSNPWALKNWYAFGTSLTNISAEGKYPNYLKTFSNMVLTNKGISGGKIVSNILAEIKATTYTNVNLITLEGFCNDWYYNSPIGTLGDTTNTTYSGAIYDALTYLLQNSTATIVGITDHTGRKFGAIDSRLSVTNSLGLKQIDYINMFVSVCKMLNVPIIEAGQKSMINEFTANVYLVDQIHQTEIGAQQYAQTIWDELKNISPRITV